MLCIALIAVDSKMSGSREILEWVKHTRARSVRPPFVATQRLNVMKAIAKNRSITTLDLGEYSVRSEVSRVLHFSFRICLFLYCSRFPCFISSLLHFAFSVSFRFPIPHHPLAVSCVAAVLRRSFVILFCLATCLVDQCKGSFHPHDFILDSHTHWSASYFQLQCGCGLGCQSSSHIVLVRNVRGGKVHCGSCEKYISHFHRV